ncbi:MAG TPA: sialidase family protein [Nitrososphaera sp.]|nr:sialidase family protein [Nitrososphaera sp.]
MKVFAVLIGALIAGGAATVFAFLFSYSFQPNQLQYSIVSESSDNNSLPIVFENATNLTNNPMDSVYGQVAAWNNNVYMLWQDSMSPGYTNYDIFMKSSNDNGTTFGPPVNLSNNSGFSEHPQIAAYDNNVYAIWADDTSGNREVLFTRSGDNGTSFDKIKNLSNNTSDSFNQEIAVFGDTVYVVWLNQDDDEGDETNILLKASGDGGETFGRTVNIISSNANQETFPKVAASEDSVYIAWNMADDELEERDNEGLFFVRSLDGGNTFHSIIKLNHENDFGELQIAAFDETVYVVSGGLHSVDVNGVLFTKSTDGGRSFSEPVTIDENGRFVNPLNVEVGAYDEQFSYVAAQASVSGNEEILLLEMTGNNSTKVLNLSNNPKISECPSIAMEGDNIYVVWEDMTPGNHEILYAKGVRG